jgi:hypothetical protein
MGYSTADFIAACRRNGRPIPAGVLAPTKPPRKARGEGYVGAKKAAACAAIRERGSADVAVVVHVRTPNPVNGGQGYHWRVRAERRSEQRKATAAALAGCLPVQMPAVVRLTRASPGELDDDNLRAALKSIRDQIAEFLGVDDGDQKAVRWVYGQKRERNHAVEVMICHADQIGSVYITQPTPDAERSEIAPGAD